MLMQLTKLANVERCEGHDANGVPFVLENYNHGDPKSDAWTVWFDTLQLNREQVTEIMLRLRYWLDKDTLQIPGDG